MPFLRRGDTIYKKVGGRWVVWRRAKSVEKARRMLRILKRWEREHEHKG